MGGNPVNNVTHDYLFYAGFLLNYVCACEFYLYVYLFVTYMFHGAPSAWISNSPRFEI